MTTGAIVYDPLYNAHDTGSHIESKSRLDAIMERIRGDEYARSIEIVKPIKAAVENVLANHDAKYVDGVRRLAEAGGGWLDLDTYCSSKSYDVALLAVGGAISAVDAVMADTNNAFALVRPPGHHAVRDTAMGFCIFNNVACAAKYALSRYNIKRVLIVDWDVHHGNGTQASFYDDRLVLYVSTHRQPFYPGTGDFHEVGSREGEGFTVNLPLPPGVNDDGFFCAYDQLLVPVIKQFRPELTFISAGQDIHYKDPLGGMLVTCEGFIGLTERVKSVSPRGRVIACLEGGYDLQALADSVLAICGSLFDFPTKINEDEVDRGTSRDVLDRVDTAAKIQSRYWKV
ncbi:MAG: histone deacetylase family protein [Halobacteriota archaeon]